MRIPIRYGQKTHSREWTKMQIMDYNHQNKYNFHSKIRANKCLILQFAIAQFNKCAFFSGATESVTSLNGAAN